MNTLFPRFASAIRALDLAQIRDYSDIPSEFLLDQDGSLDVRYTPFESVNAEARVVLVGLTPGFTQWRNAIAEAQLQLLGGATTDQALVGAKRTGAFSGSLRPNLVALLDSIGLQGWLGLNSCADLFGERSVLLHSTSLLVHSVSKDGANYSGAPRPAKHPFLREHISASFAAEASVLQNAVFIPLGPAVADGLEWLAVQGVLRRDRILAGLPHPSGANAERVAYFLGRKERQYLSSKTSPARLDDARERLLSHVGSLG